MLISTKTLIDLKSICIIQKLYSTNLCLASAVKPTEPPPYGYSAYGSLGEPAAGLPPVPAAPQQPMQSLAPPQPPVVIMTQQPGQVLKSFPGHFFFEYTVYL